MSIPARAHFCWLGASLPWAYVFAILSAAEKSELKEVILHHTDALEDDARLHALKVWPRVRLSRIDPIACLTRAGHAVDAGDGLAAIYRRLDNPVIRTDVLRAAILYLQGGVYLDLDTVTTATLRPLLGTPHFVRSSSSPALWAHSIGLDLVRKVLCHVPRGWEKFRRVEKFYYRGITNSVMGAEPHSPLFANYLHGMLAMPRERQEQLYALGPDLLQDVVARYSNGAVTIQEPQVFYPLPPEISEQWFRISRNVRLDAVLSTETRVVHWYASVRTKSKVALVHPRYVREHRDCQLYSALVCTCIGVLPDAT